MRRLFENSNTFDAEYSNPVFRPNASLDGATHNVYKAGGAAGINSGRGFLALS